MLDEPPICCNGLRLAPVEGTGGRGQDGGENLMNDDDTRVHPSITAFAVELGRAIEARGLTLQRIQSHLRSRGVSVSVATLSYWRNGRSVPSRSSSLAVISELEAILSVPKGTLLDSLADRKNPQWAWRDERDAAMRAALAHAGLPRTPGHEHLSVQLEAVIGPDRMQTESRTTLVSRSRIGATHGILVTLDLQGAVVAHPEAVHGLRLARTIPVEDWATIVDFAFDEPLLRSECRRTQHLIRYTPKPDARPDELVCTSSGYALNADCKLLVMSVRFTDGLPRTVAQHHTLPAAGNPRRLVRELPARPLVEVVIPDPDRGIHTIDWQW